MRPQVPDEIAESVEEIVDREAKVPAKHLTFAEQVEFLAKSHEAVRSKLKEVNQSATRSKLG